MDPVQPSQRTCPSCSSIVNETALFCPTCGKRLKEKPLSTNTTTQILLYAASIFFPPWFLWWTIRYLKSSDQKVKRIGYISLGLTIVAVMFSVWLSFTISKNLTQELNRQLMLYQDIGL